MEGGRRRFARLSSLRLSEFAARNQRPEETKDSSKTDARSHKRCSAHFRTSATPSAWRFSLSLEHVLRLPRTATLGACVPSRGDTRQPPMGPYKNWISRRLRSAHLNVCGERDFDGSRSGGPMHDGREAFLSARWLLEDTASQTDGPIRSPCGS
jgi:hypothetical protein